MLFISSYISSVLDNYAHNKLYSIENSLPKIFFGYFILFNVYNIQPFFVLHLIFHLSSEQNFKVKLTLFFLYVGEKKVSSKHDQHISVRRYKHGLPCIAFICDDSVQLFTTYLLF